MSRRYCKHCHRTVLRENFDHHLGTDIHVYFVGRRPDEPEAEVITVDSLAKALDAVTTDGWPDDQYDFDGTIPEFATAIIKAAKEAERE